ncbi:MAG: hypothetical protein FWJ62_01455 [Thermaerobacter sp.]|nr:hypothetical protein [Bacillota bacterium]
MDARAVVRLLRRLNLAAALALAAVAVLRLLHQGAVVPMLLLAGLLIVGPVEDWLKRRVVSRPVDPGPPAAQVVDQATSLALILILVAAALLAR